MAEKDLNKIAFISDYDYGTYKFRMSLFRYFDSKGLKVYVLVSHGNYSEKIKEGRIEVLNYRINRKSINPLLEIETLLQILGILRKIRPDVVHTFGIKPNIYGTLSARILGIKYIINTVTGLGSFFAEESPKKISTLIIRKIIEALLKITFHFAKKVIFLNEDDIEDLNSKNLVKKDKICLINGEGIDVNHYSPENINEEDIKKLTCKLKINSSEMIITMISRLISIKGVEEFCEAARYIKKRHNAEFLLVGNIDHDNFFAIDEVYLKGLVNEGIIKWPGFRTDIKEILYISDVFVLPSYREGVPISILEAMSMGKPIITTDVPGCRQIVKDRVSGFLVQTRDVNSLSKAIEKMILDEGLRKRMSKINREKAVKEFSTETVLNKIGALYNDILYDRSPFR